MQHKNRIAALRQNKDPIAVTLGLTQPKHTNYEVQKRLIGQIFIIGQRQQIDCNSRYIVMLFPHFYYRLVEMNKLTKVIKFEELVSK